MQFPPVPLVSLLSLLLLMHASLVYCSILEANEEEYCNNDESICDSANGRVCLNSTCVTACKIRDLKNCRCPTEEDHYCYLCCGDTDHECRPAHQYSVLRPNGERWERSSCTFCSNSATPDGLNCDDKDERRVCRSGKCIASICQDKMVGSYCDLKSEQICVENECRNPCAAKDPKLYVCECEDTSYDDRCQLCCYDPFTKVCSNAYQRYGIVDTSGRPIIRGGLDCRRGTRTCNRFGICAAPASRTLSTGLLIVCLAATVIIPPLCCIYMRRP